MRIFISDLHLGNCFIKLDLLKQFLGYVRESRHSLVLVGDTFDFWRTQDFPEASNLFEGMHVTLLLGNHDRTLSCVNFNPTSPTFPDAYQVRLGHVDFLAAHGDVIDPSMAYPNAVSKHLDRLVYAVSSLVGVNFREWLKPISDYWYRYKDTNTKLKAAYPDCDILITGHTHISGHTQLDKYQIFNLGSWLHEPYAFALKDDGTYAFYEITADHLLPSEEDFDRTW
jgi:UDP-2,3-diacylglucosamine pyrophosphatase LpxH